MSELKPVSTTEKGVRFKVDSALIGKDVKLRKHPLRPFTYKCPFCSSRQSFDVNDIRIAFKSQVRFDLDPLWNIQRYDAFARDLANVEKQADFIGYLIERSRVYKKHGDSMGQLQRRVSAVMELKCTHCAGKAIFNVVAEAETKATVPTNWMRPIGAFVSELRREISAEDLSRKSDEPSLFEIFDSDDPDMILRLDNEGPELLRLLDSLPLTWNGHDGLIWLLDWEDYAHKTPVNPQQCAHDFVQRIQGFRSDMERVPVVSERLMKAADEVLSDSFKTASARYRVESLAGAFAEDDFKLGLLQNLRRQTVENLFWLQDQINELMKSGKLEAR